MSFLATAFIAIVLIRLIFRASRGKFGSTSRHGSYEDESESPKIETRNGLETSESSDRWDD